MCRGASRTRRQRTCFRIRSRQTVRVHRGGNSRRCRSRDAARAARWRDLQKGSLRCWIRRPAARRLYRTRPNARPLRPRRRAPPTTTNRSARLPAARTRRWHHKDRRSAIRGLRPRSLSRRSRSHHHPVTGVERPRANRASCSVQKTRTPQQPRRQRGAVRRDDGAAAAGDHGEATAAVPPRRTRPAPTAPLLSSARAWGVRPLHGHRGTKVERRPRRVTRPRCR